MRRLFLPFLMAAGVAVGPSVTPVLAQGVELPPVELGTLRETLRGVTKHSGNTGFGDLISGLTALDIATAPLGSPTGGILFSFIDEVSPLRESVTFTPLLLERASTTGRLSATFGFNIASSSYDTISGFALDSLPIASFQGPSPLVSSSTLDLGVDVLTMTGFATVGLTDNIDVGVAVPFVGVTLRGSQTVQEAAVGTAVFRIDDNSFGLGDIGVTGKYRLWRGPNARSGLAAHVTLRAPTGNADQLRGIDPWRTMVSGTASVGVGRLSVHGTAGYEFWSDSVALSNTFPDNLVETWFLTDQLRYGAGFELQAASALTVSLEAVSSRIGGEAGQLQRRVLGASAPGVGIQTADLLSVGSGGLTKTLIVPGVSVSIEDIILVTFRTVMSLDDTGLRDKFLPILSFSWAMCSDY